MDIYFISNTGECSEFKETLTKPKETVSIIISPLRVEGKEGNIKVAHGCNLWRACQNKECYFSVAGRTGAKIKARTD